jgi:PAS domain S-box-containing protein
MNNQVSVVNGLPNEKGDPFFPLSLLSVVQDAAPSKDAEADVKLKASLFTSFMNNTPNLVWIVDKNIELVFANQKLLNYFNADETAFGKNIFDLIPKSIASIFSEKHALVSESKLPDQSIMTSMTADGREMVYQITIFPIYEALSELMIGGMAIDITESYHARQETKKSNEHLLNLSKATSDGIWDWNIITGHIFANQSLHNLIGSDLNDVIDMNWVNESIHEEDRNQVECIIKTVLEKKEQTWESEYRFKNKDGEYLMVHNRGFVIYENNEPIRMIGTVQDISEIKKLEAQLFEQQLQQQKGVAEAVIQSQEEERARIGHELHDNVNQILSTAQLYLRLLDPQKENFSEIKEKSLESVLLGIEEIRKLSKEMVIPNLRGDGLIASINAIVEDLRFINPFHIYFEHDLQSDIESISKATKINIFRIVQEQVKNIIKYSQAESVEISLHCSNKQLRLLISDDGIGFDSKNTRLGMGLSNIYRRSRLDNGKVILNTSPGNGCSLIVNIPIDAKSIFYCHMQ